MDDANDILHCEHNADDMDATKTGPYMGIDTRDMWWQKDDIDNDDGDQKNTMKDDKEEYSYLILDQFNNGKKNEVKNIIQDENFDAIIHQQINFNH